jgi:autonomous glycyl radical cofactor GrcA
MRKSTIFISAVLTTFALVILYQVASAYNNKDVTEVAAEPTAILEPTATEPAAPTDVALGPEAAAQLAAQVVGNTNLLSAESSNFNGVDAYLITFTNNDVVYIGLDGQILAVQVAPVVVNVAPPRKNNGGNHQTVNVSSGGESHEDDDDHDEDHEDEHDD